jgi:undecaprenyl-diphosphatase
VLGATAVAVSDQTYLTGEASTVEALNDIPTWIGWPFRLVMQLGTLPAGLVVIGVVAWRTIRRDAIPTVALALTVAVAFRLDNVLKDIIDRPRPPAVLDGLAVREHIGGFGFPSGHATMAFALAAVLQPILSGRWRAVVWLLATIVALARMHVGVHWPADLVGGAALGIAIASAAWLLVVSARSRSSDRRSLRS